MSVSGEASASTDWRTQEIGVAAACSGDEQLIEDYTNGDCYRIGVMHGLTNAILNVGRTTTNRNVNG
jgi:hypothetical protein